MGKSEVLNGLHHSQINYLSTKGDLAPPDMPEGLKFDNGLCYGMRNSHPGLFEIKLHRPLKKNAMKLEVYRKLAELIFACQKDNNVKVIMLHGGKNFSVGNDISEFAKVKDMK